MGTYEDGLKTCILAAKNQGQKALAQELCERAALFALARLFKGQSMSIMAVPPSRQGERFRGYSIPQLLELEFVQQGRFKRLGERERSQYRRFSSSSKHLNRSQRVERRRRPRKEPTKVQARGRILLIDDVVASGASMGDCIAQAREQGFDEVIALALALRREDY